ncbi:MAG: hypothetical protein GKR87_04945 [Kiritimatiellae bacterium]|nr:hypothetical protein [Kiritimatiellia bacterium]
MNKKDQDCIVLINNVYSYRNRGDSAIAEVMAQCIRSIRPDAKIYLLSQFWKENTPYYKALGLYSRPPLWDIPMDNNKVRRLFRAIYLWLKAFWGLFAGYRKSTDETTPVLYRKARMIIDAGGGSLFSSNRYLFYLGLCQHLFNLWIGKLINKPVLLAPQSIGPLTKSIDLQAVSKVLKKLDVVMVREPISGKIMEQENVPCELVPDVAFIGSFRTGPSERVQPFLQTIDVSALNIGVTVLDWRWAEKKVGQDPNRLDQYIQKIETILFRLHKEQGAHIFIFPHADVSFGNSDLAISEKLQRRLKTKQAKVHLVNPNLSASDLCHTYRAMKVFLGSRMHSCILAMLEGTPCISLAYQHKTLGTFEWLGLKEYAFNAYQFEPEQVFARIEKILHQYEKTKHQFDKATTWAQQEAKTNFNHYIRPFLK